MKEYFKSYMVENFKGVYEEQFQTLKISKWIAEHVSKRTAQYATFMEPVRAVISQSLSNFKTDSITFSPLVSILGKRERPNELNPDIMAWFHEASDLLQKMSNGIDSFFKSWNDVLNMLPGDCAETDKAPMSTDDADLSLLGLTPVFMNLFWPFRFDMNTMNQRLAAYGLTKKMFTNNETLKEKFFEELENFQGIRLPVKGNQIMFIFEEEDVVEGLNRSKLVPYSRSYTKARKHLYTKDEQEKIKLLANEALDVINKTHTELYSAMVQMVSCIAFFKDEADMFTSGTVNSALGLIWLDPRQDWTVSFMTEKIVHEFIHTSLFYADLVHGGYKDVSRLSKVKAMSALRLEPRNYDKSLHAAYVSAGLITFHSRAGFLDRAAAYSQTLPGAVQELNRVNAETDVLDEAGRAMLDFLTDYVCLLRI
ncbi:uncharacterized protein LOC124141598 [Haliotis rufescens]|uniref:uncharacterized protein LOC124141598 n=1 Tax=Haliotis rufescens TaxID=6454 RepID=UPI00201EA4CB|nr:uncharacterized protein LOC124141598 [Haliotis rufescens]